MQQQVIRRQLIVGAVDKEFGLLRFIQVLIVEQAGRGTKANHGLYAVIDGCDTQADIRAEGKTTQNDGQASIAMAQKIQGVTYIVHFSMALVVCSSAVPYAAEVEAERGHTKGLQCLYYLKDHLVVHRAAAKRMRVADERGIARNDSCLFWFEDALKLTSRGGYVGVQYPADSISLLSRLRDMFWLLFSGYPLKHVMDFLH